MTALLLAALLPTLDAEAAGDVPTWSGEVAAIVHAKCSGCHQPGQSGPFDLLSYDDAVEHSETIAAVIDDGYMPPWPPTASPELMHDRRLAEPQERTLLAWVRGGTPAGDLDAAPQPTLYDDGWRLGTPDLVVEMDRVYEVPADGRDIYRWFALPLDLDEDKYVTAIEFQPTARGAVHHVLFYYDQSGRAVQRERLGSLDGQPGFRGMRTTPEAMLGGYVPGAVPQKYPDGLGVRLPAGSDLVLQTHFHPSGKRESERSKVALYFADRTPDHPLHAVQLPPAFGRMAGIDIPAGEADWTLTDDAVLPTDVTAIGVSGHAHYVCSEMAMTATLPDGSTQTLLEIADWDLDWQGDYLFERPIDLPAGTRLSVTIKYDNSAANPDNPFSPPRRIKWGPQSTDEMGSMTLQVITGDAGDDEQMKRAIKRHRVLRALPNRAIEKRLKTLPEPSVAERIWFAALDRSQDGKLQKGETPEKYHELHDMLDVDSDGGVSMEEMRALRAYGIKLPAR